MNNIIPFLFHFTNLYNYRLSVKNYVIAMQQWRLHKFIDFYGTYLVIFKLFCVTLR